MLTFPFDSQNKSKALFKLGNLFRALWILSQASFSPAWCAHTWKRLRRSVLIENGWFLKNFSKCINTKAKFGGDDA